MNAPLDLAAVRAAADAYPVPAYRDEIECEMWCRLLEGCDMPEARRRAFAWADREQREDRGRVSLDTLLEQYGDAIACAALPCPTPSADARAKRDKRAGQRATPRHEEKGIGEPDGVTLNHLISVITNLKDRGLLDDDPLICAVDIRGLVPVIRRAVLAVVQSATRAEMREAGITAAEGRAGERWLARYDARFRSDAL
jgi:hypothetical protein